MVASFQVECGASKGSLLNKSLRTLNISKLYTDLDPYLHVPVINADNRASITGR